MGFAHAYASAVLHRARTPMPPADFQPDWDDQPRPDRFFPGAERLPLPACPPEPGATTQAGLTGVDGDRPFTLPLLAGMLQDSCGLLTRRLAVHANVNVTTMPSYRAADWARGAASGGGLYPVSCYWIAGPGGPVLPGVHHYAPAHHAMERLVTGDVSAQVRAALAAPGAEPPGPETDQYLVLGVKYWRNAFKYAGFAYHVVSMDVGAVLQTWRVWARAHGLRIGPLLWFDETRLSGLLGLDPEREGVFAVVPLHWERSAPDDTAPATDAASGTDADTAPDSAAESVPPGTGRSAPGPAVRVRRRDEERSRVLHRFDLLEQMRRAALAGDTDRPAPHTLTPALPPVADAHAGAGAGRRTRLESAPPLDLPVRTALRERRSSFGRFSSHTSLEPGDLAAVLDAAVAAARPDGDAAGAGGTGPQPPLASLHVCVNHVRTLTAASYRYDPTGGTLLTVRDRPPGSFLQRAYTLDNYNVEQAGAVLVASVRTAAVLDAVGDRGYRLVGAVVGAMAQAVYTACAALGVGCGAALGFDADSYAEELALEGSDELPLLIMMIGHERPGPAGFRYELV